MTDVSGGERERFFISYAGPERRWAEWVGWELEQAGYVVELDSWDWAAGDNAVLRMNDALDRADRVVALFSTAYFEPPRFTTEEWTAVMARRDRQGRLIPLRLEDVDVPALLRPLIAPSLGGMANEAAARRVLLDAVRGPQRPQEKPPYPAGREPTLHPASDAPRLPGMVQPRLFQVPHPNSAFVGRDGDIGLVRRQLRPGKPVVIQSSVPLGGVGKTQVAAEYVHRFADQYDLIGWINAEDPQLVAGQLAAMAVDLGLVGEHAETAALPALRAHLQQQVRWLVVFDNAEALTAVQPFLPGAVGHVLITSRSRHWQEFGMPVLVEAFTRRESVTLLRGRVADLSGVDADRIAEQLGDLPLALVQAATVLSAGMPAELYLELLESAEADDLLNQGLPASYPRSLAAALRMSIDGLAGDDEELDLLRICCVFAPEPIPLTVLGTAPAVKHPSRSVLASSMQLYQAASRLGDLARVTQRGIQIHRLVQILVLSQLDSQHKADLRLRAGALLAASHPGHPASAATWPAWAVVMPHLLTLDPGDSDDPALRDVACDALLYLLYSGDTDTGSRLADRLYGRWRERLGSDDRHTLAAAAELAHAYHNLGRDGDALTLVEDTLDRRRRTLGHDDPATLRSANDRAVVLGGLGRLTDAVRQSEEVLTVRTAVLGTDHPDTLSTRSDLASWRGQAGDHAAAIAAFEQLLTDRMRVLGPDHPNTLSTRGYLASWRGQAGDHAAAIAAFEQLLTDRMRVLGPDHPDTLSTRGYLASWRGEAGDHAAAIAAVEQLLTDRMRVLGPDHPDTLSTRGDLAGWRGEAGDHAAAIAAVEQLLTDRMRVLGPDHPDTLSTRGDLAGWRGEAGDHAAAIAAVEQLLTDRMRVLGPDHPATLATRGNLAGWRGEAGDHAAAIAAVEQLLTDQMRVLGPDHPHTLTIRGNLASWRGQAGDHAAAIAAFEQLLTDRMRVLGPDHPDTLAARGNLASWRGHAGDHAAAIAAVEQLLTDRMRVLGPDHPDTLATRGNLASWRGHAGDHAAAIAAFEQLLTDRMRVLGPDHPDTLATRSDLAIWRGQAGDHAAAIAAFEQLLTDQMRVLGPDHPQTLAARGNLAGVRGRAGDHAAAIAAFEQLLTDQMRVLGPDHPQTLAARGNLAPLLRQRGNLIGARQQAEAKLKVETKLFGRQDRRAQETYELVRQLRQLMGGRSGPTRRRGRKR